MQAEHFKYPPARIEQISDLIRTLNGCRAHLSTAAIFCRDGPPTSRRPKRPGTDAAAAPKAGKRGVPTNDWSRTDRPQWPRGPDLGVGVKSAALRGGGGQDARPTMRIGGPFDVAQGRRRPPPRPRSRGKLQERPENGALLNTGGGGNGLRFTEAQLHRRRACPPDNGGLEYTPR